MEKVLHVLFKVPAYGCLTYFIQVTTIQHIAIEQSAAGMGIGLDGIPRSKKNLDYPVNLGQGIFLLWPKVKVLFYQAPEDGPFIGIHHRRTIGLNDKTPERSAYIDIY
jgi:hypothetical protein